jgi:uncharacterized protein YjaG (DUF416 family)
MLRYDESTVLERLGTGSSRARALFGALTAERLFPLYELFAERTGQGDPARLREALDAAWAAIDGQFVDPAELARLQEVAEDLVPEEDDDWATESGYAQNAAAAVAYGLRTRLTDNPQEAAWAARQANDFADYVAQRQLEDLELDAPGAEDALADQPIVQEALAGIEADLAAALGDPPPDALPALRDQARKGGETLVELARSAT